MKKDSLLCLKVGKVGRDLKVVKAKMDGQTEKPIWKERSVLCDTSIHISFSRLLACFFACMLPNLLACLHAADICRFKMSCMTSQAHVKPFG